MSDMTNDPQPASTPWLRQPLMLGVVGVALMLGGWKLSTWTPPRENDSEQVRRFNDLKQKADRDDPALSDRLRRFGPQPRFLWVGRLGFFAGLVLFIVAGVAMYRRPEERPVSESDSHSANEQGTLSSAE